MEGPNGHSTVGYTKPSVPGNPGHVKIRSYAITGHDLLIRSNANAGMRAALAAQLITREVDLIKPTAAQAALLTHSGLSYVYAALRLSQKARERIAAGELSFADMRGNSLVSAWLISSPAEKAALGCAVGVDKIWDGVIEPSF